MRSPARAAASKSAVETVQIPPASAPVIFDVVADDDPALPVPGPPRHLADRSPEVERGAGLDDASIEVPQRDLVFAPWPFSRPTSYTIVQLPSRTGSGSTDAIRDMPRIAGRAPRPVSP